MNQAQYIGMDVHQATISVAVLDAAGKLILESVLETKASTILQFLAGLRGSLSVTLEEGTSAAWLRMRPTMARLTLARKIAAITLMIWKKGVDFDAQELNRQAA